MTHLTLSRPAPTFDFVLAVVTSQPVQELLVQLARLLASHGAPVVGLVALQLAVQRELADAEDLQAGVPDSARPPPPLRVLKHTQVQQLAAPVSKRVLKLF